MGHQEWVRCAKALSRRYFKEGNLRSAWRNPKDISHCTENIALMLASCAHARKLTHAASSLLA